jgi:hypothetical protein
MSAFSTLDSAVGNLGLQHIRLIPLIILSQKVKALHVTSCRAPVGRYSGKRFGELSPRTKFQGVN